MNIQRLSIVSTKLLIYLQGPHKGSNLILFCPAQLQTFTARWHQQTVKLGFNTVERK